MDAPNAAHLGGCQPAVFSCLAMAAAERPCWRRVRIVSSIWSNPRIAVGADISVFGTAQLLGAWAGLCPANYESAAKQRRRGTRLKAMLVGTAVSASWTKGSDLRDKFHWVRVPMGTKKATVAVAHQFLVAAFHMLQRPVAFADLGADDLDRVDRHRTAKRLVRCFNVLGYNVMLRPKTAN